MRLRLLAAAVAVCLCTGFVAAQMLVAMRISRVENGLVGPVVVKGRSLGVSKLEDRMRDRP